MRLIRIYNEGKILNKPLYLRLQLLDSKVFAGCNNEFKNNRDWWVMLNSKKEIIAYCGCLYDSGICIFVRAWVYESFRGKGIQRKMIAARIKAAAKKCETVITYTYHTNCHSANNLIKSNFLLYEPAYKYAGSGQLYFKLIL